MNRAEEAIANRFSRLLERITPDSEDAGIAEHRASIKGRLDDSFQVSKVELIGSHSRNTAIKGYSDIDLMAVLRRSEVTWGGSFKSSETVLKNVRNDLTERYPRTAVRRDGQAVVVPFDDGGESVDVVPAYFMEMTENNGRKYALYAIPDGEGGWVKTAPQLHGAYIEHKNTKSGRRLAGTARLVKWLAQQRDLTAPLSSFHVEMLLASEEICGVAMSYAECVAAALRKLRERKCSALQDPFRISGWIRAVPKGRLGDFFNSVDYMAGYAAHAISVASNNNDFQGALKSWDIVFNHQFPA